MAIVLKNILQNPSSKLYLASGKIIGVMGNNAFSFLNSLKGDKLYYLDFQEELPYKSVYDVMSHLVKENDLENIVKLLKEWHLEEEFLNKKIDVLSGSERKILHYFQMFFSNANIIVIEEPFLELDSFYKNKVMVYLKNMVRNKKTVIVGSNDSNTIYSLCHKVLLINDNNYLYGDVLKIMIDKDNLKDYNIEEPDLVRFVNLVREKNVFLNYSVDIRDLIKDVYKNVSKKEN